jgi:predicted amidohydrolase
MPNNLNITRIQTSIKWENKEYNLSNFAKKIHSLRKNTDLIILPELCTTGFTMNVREHAESMDGETVNWFKQMAISKGCAITGSIIIQEQGNYLNRLIWADKNGQISYYDKKHLFRMGKENDFYTSGKNKLITELNGWKIQPMICYDLRFPVWSRNTEDVDLMIYVAHWPGVRTYPWKQLLIARAIENQCYVCGINAIGLDGNGIEYLGNSMVIDAKGNPLWQANEQRDLSHTIELNRDALERFRQKFPVLKDVENFTLHQ